MVGTSDGSCYRMATWTRIRTSVRCPTATLADDRDIKPNNFLIHSPSRLTLTDFGSSATLVYPPADSNDIRPYITKQNCLMPIGTPDYIAPEILKMAEDAMMDDFGSGASDIDIDPDKTVRPGDLEEPRGYGPDVDWWSFGATIYEMAIGQAPFYAGTVRETYDLITRCGVGRIGDEADE